MGHERLMSCLEKRDFLNQSGASVDACLSWGEGYLDQGLVSDAIDFFQKAGADEALKRVINIAMEDGDTFLFRRICSLLGKEPTREEWLCIAVRAKDVGKYRFALAAYRRAGAEEEVTQIEQMMLSETAVSTPSDGPKVAS